MAITFNPSIDDRFHDCVGKSTSLALGLRASYEGTFYDTYVLKHLWLKCQEPIRQQPNYESTTGFRRKECI